MEDIQMLFGFIGGLGLFLYGMHMMADGLQKTAGNRIKNLMGQAADHRMMGIFAGAAVTAMLQSSSAATVMIVGFVNAGIIGLSLAVGIIMGANIGTTATSWLVSMQEIGNALNPEFYAPLLIGVGVFLMLFCKTFGKKQIGEILTGLGAFFTGLSFISGAIEAYSHAAVFEKIFDTLGNFPLLGLLTGTAVTALLRRSSASIGVLQTMAFHGMVPWDAAVYIILGQNIGTCITTLISGAGAKNYAKRAAVIHLLFNAFGSVIFGIGMSAVFVIWPSFANAMTDSIRISIFHTVFNIINTLILFPFTDKLIKLSGMIVKDKKKDTDTQEKLTEESDFLRHLDRRILESPAFAVQNAAEEVVQMAEITIKNIEDSFEAILDNNAEKIKSVCECEKSIDRMAKRLSDYLIKISRLSLSEDENTLVNHLFYSVSDIERMGDHAENIADLAKYKLENKIAFSETAKRELEGLMTYVINGLSYALKARQEMELAFVEKEKEYEDLVDYVESELREKHIERLAQNRCQPASGIVYLDVLSNLERISDHADNIAGYVKRELKK